MRPLSRRFLDIGGEFDPAFREKPLPAPWNMRSHGLANLLARTARVRQLCFQRCQISDFDQWIGELEALGIKSAKQSQIEADVIF
jgi:hypothetical protein